MKNYAKTTLCMALSAAMLFMDMGVPVSAAEYLQEETQREIQEMQDNNSVEETSVGTDEVEIVMTQTQTEELEAISEEETSVEQNAETSDTTGTVVVENSVETVPVETEPESETEVQNEESINKLAVSDTDIAHGEYKENGNDITWTISSDGKLTVEGTGNFLKDYTDEDMFGSAVLPSWIQYRDKIVTAEVKVTGMTDASRMFEGCNDLTSVDLSGFDTSKVTDMSYMFGGCWSLTSVDVSNFDTSNVKDMNSMFLSCSSLTSVDLSNFDTSNVTNMAYMFQHDNNLASVDLTGFDTRKVESMFWMFLGCSNLRSLDLSSFDASNAIHMNGIFGMMADPCEMDILYTPKNVTQEVELYKTMYDMAGNEYQYLPMNREDSILLQSNKTPEAVDVHITAAKGKRAYVCGETLNTDDITVRYYGTDGSVIELAQTEYTTNAAEIDMSTEGNKTLTVTYNDMTADIKLTIVEKVETPPEPETSGEPESSGRPETSGEPESSSEPETSGEPESSSESESAGSPEPSSEPESSGEPESPGEQESEKDIDDSPYDDNERTAFTTSNTTIAKIKSKVYDGEAYAPTVKVTFTVNGKKTTLTEGTDYRVLYQKNTDAGTGTVVVRGNGIYKGEVTADFTITPKPLKKLKIVTGAISASQTKDFPLYVYDGSRCLAEGTDYTLKNDFSVNPKKTAATLTVEGKGNYANSVVAKFKVYDCDPDKLIREENVTFTVETVQYTGKAIKDIVKDVTIGSTKLDPKKDYKVQYQNNKNAGTAYAIITGKGKYKGKAIKPFTILADENKLEIKPITKKLTYSGKLQKPSVTVTANGKKLSKKDFTVTYKNNLHAGTATVIVTGKGNHSGKRAEASFTIGQQQIKKASVKGTKDKLVVTYKKQVLKEGTDYEKPVYGTENKNKVEVTIKGKGDFTGEAIKKVKVGKEG